MMVLPLGITFTAILQSAAAYTRTQKLLCAIFSILIVAADCVFYFARNSYITYNCDGGLLLTFISIFFLGIIYAIRSEEIYTRVGNFLLSAFMFAGFVGIAYWDRPTFIPVSDYTPYEISSENAKYQDYISAFANGEGGKIHENRKAARANGSPNQPAGGSVNSPERLDVYISSAENVIARMREIMTAIDEFEPLAANISEADREVRSSQALAINNNAAALNRKVVGMGHPQNASDAHAELIQASENVRLAAYSLYNYTLRENPEDQLAQYKQARNQIAQMNAALSRFWNDIENLKSNNQPQQNVENEN